jgi:regulator of cell morphogenesis and NO signaling
VNLLIKNKKIMIQYMEIDVESTLGDIVTNDFRAAGVFKGAGIDFCCGGGKTLDQACLEKGIDAGILAAELRDLAFQPAIPSQNFNDWALDFLADYIQNTHHKYVLKTLPELDTYTQKIAAVHGPGHPELPEVAGLFAQVIRELRQHLRNEEEVLFPAIKEALKSNSTGARETIASEINRMKDEHDSAGGAMDRINVLTSGYEVPEGACNTYLVTLKLLEQFEDDLHIHVHLENNILFPKALKL